MNICVNYFIYTVHQPRHDAHAQDVVVSDDLLLVILKAFAHCSRLLLEQSVAPTNRRPVPPPLPAPSSASHRTRHAPAPRGCHLVLFGL